MVNGGVGGLCWWSVLTHLVMYGTISCTTLSMLCDKDMPCTQCQARVAKSCPQVGSRRATKI